jgi:hypothetical protein
MFLISDSDANKENSFLESTMNKLIVLRRAIMKIEDGITSKSSNPATPSTGSANAVSVKINEALKLEKLLTSSTLAEFRSWKTNFQLYSPFPPIA